MVLHAFDACCSPMTLMTLSACSTDHSATEGVELPKKFKVIQGFLKRTVDHDAVWVVER